MKMIRIGNVWLNPELIAEVQDHCDPQDGECQLHVQMTYKKFYPIEGEYGLASYRFAREERDAMLRWLSENSETVAAPKALQGFNIGNTVKVIASYDRRCGVVIREERPQHYTVRFDDNQVATYREDQLELVTETPGVPTVTARWAPAFSDDETNVEKPQFEIGQRVRYEDVDGMGILRDSEIVTVIGFNPDFDNGQYKGLYRIRLHDGLVEECFGHCLVELKPLVVNQRVVVINPIRTAYHLKQGTVRITPMENGVQLYTVLLDGGRFVSFGLEELKSVVES